MIYVNGDSYSRNAIREPYDFKLYGRCGHPNTLSHKEFAGEINDRLTRY